MTRYTRKTVTGQAYLFIEQTAPADLDGMARAMGTAFSDILAFMHRKDIAPAGSALSVYPAFNKTPMKFRAGFFVHEGDAAKASGTVKSGHTPAGDVVTLTHTGPYAGLAASYKMLMEEMQHDGLSYATPAWEVYLDDPDTTPPTDLRTEIFIALAAAPT